MMMSASAAALLVRYVHRRLDEGEIYWINNRKDRIEEIEATFRVQGKEAELWHPETGRIEPASYLIANGRTTVPLKLNPNEAVFVVFRTAVKAQSRTLPRQSESSVAISDSIHRRTALDPIGFMLESSH